MNWINIIENFLEEIEKEDNLFSVKDLCKSFLEGPYAKFWSDKDVDQGILYLEDWITVSEAKFNFHHKWQQIPNIKNITDYDRKEIDKTKKLIKLLKE